MQAFNGGLRSMPIFHDVINSLQTVIAGQQHPLFQTYGEFHRLFDFPGLPNTWANKNVLNAAADWYEAKNELDLTYLTYSEKTGYPSVIDGQDAKPPTQIQKDRAREVAQKIIDKYRPGTKNPY